MSSVHYRAGDTGWVQSISCDFCPATVERKGTGEIRRVPLSITDPRVVEQRRSPHEYFPASQLEIEYEEQHPFEPKALDGWGSMSRGRSVEDPNQLERMEQFDMCPTCFAVMLDQALERANQEPKCEEVQVGKEVPQRPTNLPAGYLPAPENVMNGPSPILPYNPRGMGRTGPCTVMGCDQISMTGQWHCYRHAALEAR